MALERSVLTQETAAALLKAHYGISAHKAEKMALGTANCYRVSAKEGTFFFKEFPSTHPKEQVQNEFDLLRHLAAQGLPVVEIIPTSENTPLFEHEGHIFTLQRFVEGRTFGYDDFPGELMPAMAQTLGRLHAALRDYPLACVRPEKWFDTFSAEKLQDEYRSLSAEISPDDPLGEHIRSDLVYKSGLAMRCREYIPLCKNVTYGASHGDYHGCQLICDENSVKAVTDFSSATRLPLVWEIMRSFAQSAPLCREKAEIDPAALAGYLRHYLEYAPLSRDDLAAMPYVYLVQLTRSKYGYPQYLRRQTEDAPALLNFAFWRTDICRELEKKAADISRALLNL